MRSPDNDKIKELLLTLIYWERKKLASKHLVHGPLGPVEEKGTQEVTLVGFTQTPTNACPKVLEQMAEAHQVSITPDKNVDT